METSVGRSPGTLQQGRPISVAVAVGVGAQDRVRHQKTPPAATDPPGPSTQALRGRPPIRAWGTAA